MIERLIEKLMGLSPIATGGCLHQKRRALTLVILAIAALRVSAAEQPAATQIRPSAEVDGMVTYDFVSRTGVWIARPASVVWPFMLNLVKWKTYAAGPKHLSGPVGGVGEVLLGSESAAESGCDPERLYLKVLRIDRNHQVLMKLWNEVGDQAKGYVDFTLNEVNGGTQFTYSVYLETRSESKSLETFTEAQKRGQQLAELRFDKENKRLKELVEAQAANGDR